MRYKPTKFDILNGEYLELKTETGHIVKFKLEPELSTDIDSEENNNPFFFLNLITKYEGVSESKDSLSNEDVQELLDDRNLLRESVQYDHIQIGFIYSDNDDNNHKWMLNFMDINDKYLFGFIANSIKLNCKFTTKSWEDNIWHGRFIISKNDVDRLLEISEGEFELYGKNNIDTQNIISLEDNIKKIIIRYNIHTNIWYADLENNKEKIGEIPCKNIICDVPFKGNVDRSSSKPKVTVELDADKVLGISLSLNALIIKSK